MAEMKGGRRVGKILQPKPLSQVVCMLSYGVLIAYAQNVGGWDGLVGKLTTNSFLLALRCLSKCLLFDYEYLCGYGMCTFFMRQV